MTPFEVEREHVFAQIDLTPCNGCGECWLRCEDGVPMSKVEFEALREYRSAHLDTVTRIERQNKQADLGDDVFVAICRFFDMESHRCSVYPVRPLVCRLLGHVEWMPCPIEKVKKRANTADALHLTAEYAKDVRKTYEAWEADGPETTRSA